MKKYIVGVAGVLMLPALVFAQSAAIAQSSTVEGQKNCRAITQDLAVGSTGSEVVALQDVLEKEGLLIMPPGVSKGYYGKATEVAVFKLQAKHSVPAVGKVGPATREVLKKLPCESSTDNSVVRTITKVQYNENGSEGFVYIGIKGHDQNIKVYSWELLVSCSTGLDIVIPSKTDKQNDTSCGQTYTYYGHNYFDVTEDMTVITAGVINSARTPGALTLTLMAYNAQGVEMTRGVETVSFKGKGDMSKMPDLKIAKMDCKPNPLHVNEWVTCKITVENVGNATAAASQINVQGSLVDVGRIKAGQKKTVVAKDKFMLGQPGGPNTLNFVADALNVVVESDENNNVFAKDFPVIGDGSCPPTKMEGDADLDGDVDSVDYNRINNGFAQGLTGWENGDFNCDGIVDFDDFVLIDRGYNAQNQQTAKVIIDNILSTTSNDPQNVVRSGGSARLYGTFDQSILNYKLHFKSSSKDVVVNGTLDYVTAVQFVVPSISELPSGRYEFFVEYLGKKSNKILVGVNTTQGNQNTVN